MDPNTETLRFTLGLKLRNLRHEQGLSLKQLAAKGGLSISYLSEIEKGKKYPKPEKLIELSQALGVPFDDLVSLKVSDNLSAFTDVFNSEFLHEFPFELFGLEAEDLFGLLSEQPTKAAALLRTFIDIGRMYDVEVEQFLLAALRSYQAMHGNHFPELEQAAADFRQDQAWADSDGVSLDDLRSVLVGDFGYEIDEDTLGSHPTMHIFRSTFVDGKKPKLFLNHKLLPEQKAFVLAREVGYQVLELDERVVTSSWIRVESFEEVLNNFKASYFAGSLLIPPGPLVDRLGQLFARDRWDSRFFLDGLHQASSTPEMYFHRLTEVVPTAFDFKEVYFLRFSQSSHATRYRLTKVLNMSDIPLPQGTGLEEHFCRRWSALKIIDQLADGRRHTAADPVVAPRRSYFIEHDQEFFVVSMARPLALDADANSSVTIGFRLNDHFKDTVRFWDDQAVPRIEVDITCERCPLTAAQCRERVAEPTVLKHRQEQARRREALEQFLAERT